MARGDHMVLVNQPGAQFKTRLPDSLHERLKAAAVANKRSANAELIARLEASFLHDATALNSEIAALIDWHVEQEVRRRLQQIATQIGGA